MGATVTLGTTTLVQGVGSSDRSVKVASTSGLIPGIRLFVDGEQMRVVSLGVSPAVNVLRGVDGTAAAPHSTGATAYTGRADQFYSTDPVGAPPAEALVSPWINLANGSIWFAQGDTVPGGQNKRWWQRQVLTNTVGPLGVRGTSVDLSSST